ncbi:hypothetical protein F4802DRAFT_366290 [Xylaria palmicola]|nr:hypothetical protein F4802DRAFT_366290 [Xylaria palmicola]
MCNTHLTRRDYEFYDYIDAWVLGNFIQAPSFQNDMMRLLVLHFDVWSNEWDLGCIRWDTVPRNSTLRPFLLDVICCILLSQSEKKMKLTLDGLPQGMFRCFLRRIADGGGPANRTRLEFNRYRVQEEGEAQ